MPEAEIEIRRAGEADVAAIARVHVAAWQHAYRGQLPDAVIDSFSVESRTQRWRELLTQPGHDLLVALRAGTLLGFCSLIAARDAGAGKEIGEIAALYVAPEHWRTGAGRRLLQAGQESARQRQFRELTLWVLVSNERARAFYSSVGYAADGAEKIEHRNGHPLHELRYRRSLAVG